MNRSRKQKKVVQLGSARGSNDWNNLKNYFFLIFFLNQGNLISRWSEGNEFSAVNCMAVCSL